VLALLADAYVRSAAPAPTVEARAPRRLRTLALVLVPLLLIPSAATIAAAFTPTPMRPLGDPPVPGGVLERTSFPGVQVRKTAGGVSIEASDGGGAGAVRAGFDPRNTGLIVIDDGSRYGVPGSWAVIVTDGDQGAYTIVNGDGVRLDDSLGERVLGRLGVMGGTALALGVVLLLVLAWRLGVSLGEARTLDAPDLDAPGKGARKGLLGTLSIAKSATLTRARRSIRIAGEAWIDADGLRIRLPEGTIPALSELDRDPHQGQPIVLVSRFERALTANLREAAAQWPDDGLLVLGTREDAREALARRAATAAAWIALPLAACVFTATAALLISL
jgi:hypothetical protein